MYPTGDIVQLQVGLGGRGRGRVGGRGRGPRVGPRSGARVEARHKNFSVVRGNRTRDHGDAGERHVCELSRAFVNLRVRERHDAFAARRPRVFTKSRFGWARTSSTSALDEYQERGCVEHTSCTARRSR